jgi:cation:H+ antiporter
MVSALDNSTIAIAAFLIAAAVVLWAGLRMTAIADTIADRTGLGEAVIGGLLLGLSTSLPGIVTSVWAAANDEPALAVTNAVGGIAAQTTFLVAADILYRRVNLEHAAADVSHLIQASSLIVLLSVAIAASLAPPVSVLGVHPISLVLFAAFALSSRASFQVRTQPTWRPDMTSDTREDTPADEPDDAESKSNLELALTFAGLAGLLTVSGIVIAQSGTTISAAFGVSTTVVGFVLTAVATSLPELVTTIAAVRRGALQLAVGGIIGGNTFDVLFLGFADIAYRDGSIYHAVTDRDVFMIAVAILISAILLTGIIMRDRRGIGFEGGAILVVYVAAVAVQIALG